MFSWGMFYPIRLWNARFNNLPFVKWLWQGFAALLPLCVRAVFAAGFRWRTRVQVFAKSSDINQLKQRDRIARGKPFRTWHQSCSMIREPTIAATANQQNGYRKRVMTPINNYFSFNEATLKLRNERLELISENIANVSTPGYKAKDIDFGKALQAAQRNLGLQRTQDGHVGGGAAATGAGGALVYRVPLNPSLDNNTVEIGVEQAQFGRASADYMASLQFLENRISGLRKAIRGE